MSNQPPPKSKDEWSSTAQNGYTQTAGRVTQRLCTKLVAQSLSLSHPATYILDNGAGTGNLTCDLRVHFPDAPILAADISPGMLAALTEKKLSNVHTRVADALDLRSGLGADGRDGTFSHVYSSFMIQFCPDARTAVREMVRVLEPGGVFALGTWGWFQVMQVVHRVCAEVDPEYAPPPIYVDNEWPLSSEGVRDALEGMGLKDVDARECDEEGDFPLEVCVNYMENGDHPFFVPIVRHMESVGLSEKFGVVLRRQFREVYDREYLKIGAILATARKA